MGGIYHRFKEEHVSIGRGNKQVKRISKEENPILFEEFVARIMENILGERAVVTPPSGDWGVDIIHTLPNRDVYLVQVKCCKLDKDIRFDPLAVLHSNIITCKAHGAYFDTTSNYSPQAKQFAEEQGIKLINGYELAQFWMGAKGSWVEEKPIKFTDRLLNALDWIYEKVTERLQRKLTR